MKDDDTKIVFWRYLALDYKVVQDYLEDMALEGYELISIYSIIPFAKFKKITPRRIRYYTDVFELDERKSNIELYEKLGWKLVGSSEEIYIFKEKYNNAKVIPIKKDKDIIIKSLIKKEYILLFEFFVLLILFCTSITILDYEILLSYASFGNLFYLTVTMLYSIIYILYLFSYLVKLKRSIKEEEILRVPTVESANIRAYCNYLYVVSFKAIVILFMLGTFFNLSKIIPIVLTIIAVGTVSVILIKKSLRNTDKIRKIRNTVLVVAVMAVISFVSLAQFNFNEVLNLSFSDYDYDEIRQMAVEYPVLKLDCFFQDKDLDFMYAIFNEEKSPFIDAYYSYKEVTDGKGILSTDYYEAKNTYFAKIVFDGILNEKSDTNIKYINSSIFNADKVVYFENFKNKSNSLLILHRNITIFISGEIDFLTEQNSKKVIEVLNL